MEWKEERKSLFEKVDKLDNVIHVLEATANCYYNPKDKMWNVLLGARDKIKKHIEKEKQDIYDLVEKKDKEVSSHSPQS